MMAGETARETNLRVFGTEQPVAFVTGSLSPRVGKVVAHLLQAHHFQTVLHGHSETQPSSSERMLVLTGGVEDEQNVASWQSSIQERFGRLDLLVNCAAIWEPKNLEETNAADYLEFFRVNSLGTALLAKSFGLMMASQPQGGCIVNIGDWAVARPYPDFSAYFVSKGSIETLTRSFAVELASRNPQIRVNAIFPGPVLLDSEVNDDRKQAIIEDSLLKRAGTAEDVAYAALFLATSPFITGVCLPVDGGRSVYAGGGKDQVAHPRVE